MNQSPLRIFRDTGIDRPSPSPLVGRTYTEEEMRAKFDKWCNDYHELHEKIKIPKENWSTEDMFNIWAIGYGALTEFPYNRLMFNNILKNYKNKIQNEQRKI